MHAEDLGDATAPNAGAEGVSAGGQATKAIEDLRFDLLRSALYHDIRQTALLRLHKILTFVNIMLGSGAIAAFGAQFPLIGQFAGLAVATVGAAQLVFDFNGSARDHADLRRRYYSLLATAQRDTDPAAIAAEMTLIYADEPPLRDRVNRRAHNQAGESMFGDDFTRV